jgi:DNA-binding transcriptional ArsR family regulator
MPGADRTGASAQEPPPVPPDQTAPAEEPPVALPDGALPAEEPPSVPQAIDFPKWIDPSRDLILTPNKLKGLSNAIRLRLLELLQHEGPATATMLAARIGRSSGVTSYHLRVLAEHGFVVEDTERGNGRDRFWRARHRSTGFTVRMPDDPATAENIDATERYLRIVAEEVYRRILAGIDLVAAVPDQVTTMPWQLNDWPLRLTIEEARELGRQISELAQQYRREAGDPDPRPGTVRAYFQLQLLPDEPPLEEPEAAP